MTSNSKLEAGLTPVQTVDVNGRRTTVYKNLNADTNSQEASSALTTKSFGTGEEFKKSSLTITSVSAANKTFDDVEEDPDSLHNPEVQARVADSLTLLSAQVAAEREHKDALKREIMDSFTERQVANNDIKWDSEGRAYVEVVDEQNRFNVSRAGLTNKEIMNCSESGMDPSEIRKQFPDTWNEIGECTGDAYVELDTNTEAYRWHKSAAAKRLSDADDRKVEGRRKQSDTISAFRRSMDRLDKAEENYSRARSVMSEASLGSDDRDEIASKTVAGGRKIVEEIYGDEPMGNHKSGTSYRFKPNEKHDTSLFRDARANHYMDVLSARNINDSEEKLQRKARTRAAADWAKVSTLKVRAEKVKEKYPKKYEKGRTERVLYLSD